jgi:hypothetical protein
MFHLEQTNSLRFKCTPTAYHLAAGHLCVMGDKNKQRPETVSHNRADCKSLKTASLNTRWSASQQRFVESSFFPGRRGAYVTQQWHLVSNPDRLTDRSLQYEPCLVHNCLPQGNETIITVTLSQDRIRVVMLTGERQGQRKEFCKEHKILQTPFREQ